MKKFKNKKEEKRSRIKKKIRSQITGTKERPRLAVFRSNKFIYAQLIDDKKGVTIGSSSDIKIGKGTKTERAEQVGKMIAEEAAKNKITSVVFDRGGSQFTGRVKALADEARKGGLNF